MYKYPVFSSWVHSPSLIVIRIQEMIRYFLFGAVIILLSYESSCDPVMSDSSEDYVPIIFLKTAKSFPRIGRSSDFLGAKLMKTMPRVGRSNGDDYYIKMAYKYTPRLERSAGVTSVEKIASWPWFSDHDFIPRLTKKDSVSAEELTSFQNDKEV